jgi:hypothetical protein
MMQGHPPCHPLEGIPDGETTLIEMKVCQIAAWQPGKASLEGHLCFIQGYQVELVPRSTFHRLIRRYLLCSSVYPVYEASEKRYIGQFMASV